MVRVIFPVIFRNPVSPEAAIRQLSIKVTKNGADIDVGYYVALISGLGSGLTLLRILSGRREYLLASAVDGSRLLVGETHEVPAKVGVRHLIINEDVDITFDLNDGSGSGTEPTEPATSHARVSVERLPLPRDVIAMEHKADGTWRYAGTTRINDTGLLELQVTGGDVYVMAADDYGAPFQPSLQIDVGATIRPSHFQGWLYRCTEAGRLPIDEPEWWPELGDNPSRPVGTARLQAVRYYQPIAHGPIKYELV